MSDIRQNAISFLQKRFPAALVVNSKKTLMSSNKPDINFWLMIAQDHRHGIKQRAIVLGDVGLNDEISFIAHRVKEEFEKIDAGFLVTCDNSIQRTGHPISTTQMVFTAKIFLYTNKAHIPYQRIIDIFSSANLLVEIIDESRMHDSLFISYGGPDEAIAAKIDAYLRSKSIKTWFFPNDALPGENLHEMMFNGINNHDRVLLICSEQSLKRSGLLNELDKVLAREAREGGKRILIPITLDNRVYEDWAPEKPAIVGQVREKVISKIDPTQFDSKETQDALKKLVRALSKERN